MKKFKRRFKRYWKHQIAEVRYQLKYGRRQRKKKARNSLLRRLKNFAEWRRIASARRKSALAERKRNKKKARNPLPKRLQNLEEWRRTTEARRKAAQSDRRRFKKDLRRLHIYVFVTLEAWFYVVLTSFTRLWRGSPPAVETSRLEPSHSSKKPGPPTPEA